MKNETQRRNSLVLMVLAVVTVCFAASAQTTGWQHGYVGGFILNPTNNSDTWSVLVKESPDQTTGTWATFSPGLWSSEMIKNALAFMMHAQSMGLKIN